MNASGMFPKTTCGCWEEDVDDSQYDEEPKAPMVSLEKENYKDE